MKNHFPKLLLAAWLLQSILLGIHPVSRTTWWAENITIWLVAAPVIWLYLKGIRLSNTAYAFMSVLAFLHTIGGHYTFAQVPFGWITDLLGAQRNHFDRLAHFSVGLWAYAIMEITETRQLSRHRGFTALFALAAILAVAGLFEIVEWLYAAATNPAAGAEFLGSQGDIWDAQKDILADGLGTLPAILLYHLRNPRPTPR